MATASRNWGIQPARVYADERARRAVNADHTSALANKGLVIIDNFLPAEELGRLAAELKRVSDAGDGPSGFSDNRQLNTIRTDKVKWMHEDDAAAAELPALRSTILMLKGVAAALEAASPGTWTLEVPTRCMLSSYSGEGSHYRAHRDSVGGSFMKDEGGWLADPEQANRELTAILYLNEGGQCMSLPASNCF